jgi:hypothetical protein
MENREKLLSSFIILPWYTQIELAEEPRAILAMLGASVNCEVPTD